MAGDYSRFGFDPKKHFSQVLLQQGRVFTDFDFNQEGSILERRFRAQTVDTVGRCVVPSETPDGFRIAIAGSGDEKSLSIGRGRIYVDGLLAENHGEAPFAFDLSVPRPDGRPVGVLGEEIGLEPTSYFEQRPQPAALPDNGILAIVYLKVWQREVTSLTDDSLLEPALGGVDTTARLQTVWQVKWLEVEDDILCSTPDAEIDPWQQLVEPSAARLSTRTVEEESDENPCLIPQTSGYTGAENQLYRVQIHDGGPVGEATFKWSRDNASVTARILSIDGRDITVDRIGRDSYLSFQNNGWVEITDDIRELGDVDGSMPGFMVRVEKIEVEKIEGDVITLADDLPDDFFPDGFNTEHNPRVIKWDSEGAIPVPVPPQDHEIRLEDGIAIEFAADPADGQFQTGDYWTFAARTASAKIEQLDQAPPHGPHYHYCRLALVRWPANDDEQLREDDCRIMWPPAGGEACGCSVCVTPETHNSGALTIHQAVAQVAPSGGTVCLESGEYHLDDEPVRIQQRNSIRMTGQGMATTLSFTGTGPAVVVDGSVDIVLERFSVLIPGLPGSDFTNPEHLGGGPGFLIRNSLRVTVKHCAVNQVPSEPLFATGVVLEGVLFETVLRDNVFFTTSGILAAPAMRRGETVSYLLSADLEISGNLFLTRDRGVGLDRLSFFFAGSTRIHGNTFVECSQRAISSTGLVFGSRLDIRENQITARGHGIVVGTDNTRVCDNDVSSLPGHGSTNGIVVTAGIDSSGIDGLVITGNRLVGLSLSAIVLGHVIHTAMIKQNLMALTEQGGLFMAAGAKAGALEIEDNQFVDIAQSFNDPGSSVAAIQIVNTDHLRIANNIIKEVARSAFQPTFRAAIDVLGCKKVFVLGNDIVDVGPLESLGVTAAVQIQPPFSDVVIQNNIVRRSDDESETVEPGDWSALRITELPPAGASFLAADVELVSPSERGGSRSADFPTIVSDPIEHRVFVVVDDLIWDAGVITNPQVTIQGNQLHARGGKVSAVQIDTGDTCILNGNQISGRPLTAGVVIASVEAVRVAASNNIIHGPNGATSLSLTADAFTVVGNITTGPIQANQETLEATTGAGLNTILPSS